MKRLRESEARTPLMRTARQLIEAAPPLPESDERMWRIRRELDRPRGGLLGVRRLPALVVAMIVGAFGASAFAAVRMFEVISQPSAELAPPKPAASTRHARRPAQHGARTPAPDESPLPVVEQPPAPVAAVQPVPRAVDDRSTPRGVESLARHDRPVHSVPQRTRGDRGTQRAGEAEPQPAARGDHEPAQPAMSSDSALVHRAVKALRRDRDPALAARLLEQHRALGGSGPLAEEALSLQIEAAAALDDPRVLTFAREYLARYPQGRYLSVARRALRDAAP